MTVILVMSQDSGKVLIQQTIPMAVTIPFLACLSEPHFVKENINNLVTSVSVTLLLGIVIGSFMMVSIDQHTMLSSRNVSISLLNRIVSELDYSIEPTDGYVFLGKMSDNPLYRKDELWDRSNAYARYGELYIGTDGDTQSYNGLLRDAGVNIMLNFDNEYWHELETNEDIKNMPVYPYQGYAQKYDDVIVIKLSEY